MTSDRLLILSDGKPGHLNQSIAFAKHLGRQYDIVPVAFRNRFAKAVSYLADRCCLRLKALFRTDAIAGQYSAIVSAGSETYYANRVLAQALGAKSVAIMLPKGYRYDFDLIVAQEHDNPPERENILSLPINLSYVEPQGLVCPEPGRRYVALVIGGDSKHAALDPEQLKTQLERIFALLPGYGFWLTTSRRTSAAVENVLRQFSFDRAVYYSEEQINPIPDFLRHSDYVFLTADSTSMISEAVSYGSAKIEIISASASILQGKLGRLLQRLQAGGYLHFFDDSLGAECRKVDLSALSDVYVAE